MTELATAQPLFVRTCSGRRPVRLASVVTLLVLGLLAGPLSAQDAPADAPENPFPNRVAAASLDGGIDWLNTSGEITLKDLRGKVVLLDFWTFCCINCMHVLPDLAYLEEKYASELVVIGVHSAKFENERDSETIREAIMRYEIRHPVINDADMTVWRKFGARGWPTLVLIDPEGYYCGYISGEGHRELLDRVIGQLVDYHRAKGTLDETPVRFDLERNKAPATPLKYPGKILADGDGDRLFISDSNHNRIVITSLDGTLRETIGTGAIGAADGGYDQAEFDHPQGMALVGETLYVADTENHLIRAIDLKSRTVSTLAGTGEQAKVRIPKGPLRSTPLNSPWALIPVDDTLYIAMAGPHQIWSHQLGSDTIGVFAGSGREDIVDGSLLEAALAQPSGLATDGSALFIVDSEGSAVRRIGLAGSRQVTTVVGTHDLPGGRSLFEFGDIDGIGTEARLQHPLGIAFAPGVLYVADSYNHKLKWIDLKTKRSETLLGTGEAGAGSDPWQFSEPAGLSIAGDTLFVADTNNHRICAVNLQDKSVRVLEIAGLEPPQPPAPADSSPLAAEDARELAEQQVAAGTTLTFDVRFKLPDGYKLNKLAPVVYRLESQGDSSPVAADALGARAEAETTDDGATIRVPLSGESGRVQVAVTYSYCRDGIGGLCKLDTETWVVPVKVTPDGSTSIQLEAEAD